MIPEDGSGTGASTRTEDRDASSGVAGAPGSDAGACSCRCCDAPVYMDACMASPDCMAYVACLRGCTDTNCTSKCPLHCDTGMEPACYLADGHAWVCGHGCGTC